MMKDYIYTIVAAELKHTHIFLIKTSFESLSKPYVIPKERFFEN